MTTLCYRCRTPIEDHQPKEYRGEKFCRTCLRIVRDRAGPTPRGERP